MIHINGFRFADATGARQNDKCVIQYMDRTHHKDISPIVNNLLVVVFTYMQIIFSWRVRQEDTLECFKVARHTLARAVRCHPPLIGGSRF